MKYQPINCNFLAAFILAESIWRSSEWRKHAAISRVSYSGAALRRHLQQEAFLRLVDPCELARVTTVIRVVLLCQRLVGVVDRLLGQLDALRQIEHAASLLNGHAAGQEIPQAEPVIADAAGVLGVGLKPAPFEERTTSGRQ